MDLSLVEIAERLEQITSLIEGERARERDARARYREIAESADRRITEIREYARTLLQEQRRRMSSFDGMLGSSQRAGLHSGHAASGSDGEAHAAHPHATAILTDSDGRFTLADAILRVWTLPGYDRPLTTEEISAALKLVGYRSRAAPRSLRSTLNQVLAKLCRDGKVLRFRIDGTELDDSDPKARARRYKAAPGAGSASIPDGDDDDA